MRWLLPILFLAATIFADPPKFPPLKVPDTFPYRLHTIQRATLVNTNRVRCTTNCPVAKTRIALSADLTGPAQFRWFNLWASTNANMSNAFKFATNRIGYFEPRFTNGPQLYFVMGEADEALPYDTSGRKR